MTGDNCEDGMPDAYGGLEYLERFTPVDQEDGGPARGLGTGALGKALLELRNELLDETDGFFAPAEQGVHGGAPAGPEAGTDFAQESAGKSVEEFLAANTISCISMRARITRRQCRINILSGTMPCCALCPRAAGIGGSERRGVSAQGGAPWARS